MIFLLYNLICGVIKMLTRIRYVPVSLFCSEAKVYKPLNPLKQGRNLLYLEKNYEQNQIIGKPPRYIGFFPSIGIIIHNFWTQWTLENGTAAIAAFLLGAIYMGRRNSVAGRKILSLQLNKEKKTLIVIVPNCVTSIPAYKKYPLNQEDGNKLGFYLPVLNQEDKKNLKNIPQKKQDAVLMILKRVFPLEIPISEIEKITFDVKGIKKKEQFEKDKVQMKPEELFQKYKHTNIIFQTKVRINNRLPYCLTLNLEKNDEQNFDDYLTAWAGGYKIQGFQNTN